MKKLLLYILLLSPFFAFAQQYPITNSLRQTEFIWNPAMTGINERAEIGVSYRQQWLGFAGAPVTGILSGQKTLSRMNMGFGGALMFDRTGPLTFIGVNGAYNYKFSLQFNDDDQLSIGVLASAGQYRYDGNLAKVADSGDELVIGAQSSQFNFNAGVGVFYSSVPDSKQNESNFYFGVAAPQLLPSKLSFTGNSNEVKLKRSLHGNIVGGFKIANESYYTEHTGWLNYADAKLYNLSYQFKFEQIDQFWGALYINTNFTAGLNCGFIWKNDMFGENGQLRVGIAGLYNLSTNGQYQGFSYELMTAARF